MVNIDRLNALIPYMNFLQNITGTDTEIILYNAVEQTVHHVINPFDNEAVQGGKIRPLEKEFIKNKIHLETDYIVNFRAVSKSKNKLKTATYFYMDENKELYAVLSVSIKVDRLIELRDIVNDMISGSHLSPESKELYNNYDVPFDKLMLDKILVEAGNYSAPADRLSYEERMDLMRNLEKQGVFLVKGAVSELAQIMKTTETSIYRYLNKLAEEKGE